MLRVAFDQPRGARALAVVGSRSYAHSSVLSAAATRGRGACRCSAKIGLPSSPCSGFGRDLDADDVAALERLWASVIGFTSLGYCARELLQLQLVVGEMAVGRVAARQRADAAARATRSAVGARLRLAARRGRPPAPCSGIPAFRSFARPRPYSTTSTALASPFSVRSSPSVCRRRLSARVGVETLTIGLAAGAPATRDERGRDVRLAGAPAEAAGLHEQPLAPADEALGQLVAAEGGRGGHAPALACRTRRGPSRPGRTSGGRG